MTEQKPQGNKTNTTAGHPGARGNNRGQAPQGQGGFGAGRGGNDSRGRGGRGGGRRDNSRGGSRRPRPEFDQKIIDIRRVTRVVSGGRRFSFSVAIVIGDKKGKVGVGIGKASDTALAIDKAIRDAKKGMITPLLTKTMSIAHEISVKYSSSRITLMPTNGKGIVAGSSVRTVLELAGIKGVTAKIFSKSKNKLNNARAAIEALKLVQKPRVSVKK